MSTSALLILVAVVQLGVGVYLGWLLWDDGVAKTLGRYSPRRTRGFALGYFSGWSDAKAGRAFAERHGGDSVTDEGSAT